MTEVIKDIIERERYSMLNEDEQKVFDYFLDLIPVKPEELEDYISELEGYKEEFENEQQRADELYDELEDTRKELQELEETYISLKSEAEQYLISIGDE